MNPLQQHSVNPVPRLTWHGASGTAYEFEHFALGGVTWNAVGGVYIFCRLATDGRWYAVYIGETNDFSVRLANNPPTHERWYDVTRAGATHICAMVVSGNNAAQRRLDIETDLRHRQNPPCNRQ